MKYKISNFCCYYIKKKYLTKMILLFVASFTHSEKELKIIYVSFQEIHF